MMYNLCMVMSLTVWYNDVPQREDYGVHSLSTCPKQTLLLIV